jgi:aryl-alcohol dehydrogenase-like predicted oxidoreductase
MEQRRLGSSSLYIPPLVFGGNVLGWSAGRRPVSGSSTWWSTPV